MITTPKRRSPKATVPTIAIERATVALQQLPPKPTAKAVAQPASSKRRTRTAIDAPTRTTRKSVKTSIVAALNATAIAEKKAFLNRKIRDVISVLLDDLPPKPTKPGKSSASKPNRPK